MYDWALELLLYRIILHRPIVFYCIKDIQNRETKYGADHEK